MFRRISDNQIPQNTNSLESIYDEIRMRDEDGHPLAYIDYGNFRIEFRRASLRRDCVEADIKIYVKK